MEKSKFIEICNNASSMAAASRQIPMDRHNFRKLALEYGCYRTNQGGKGMSKPQDKKYSTEDILAGKYPNYGTHHLKVRLLEEGLKIKRCERKECGITEWNGQKIVFELHHKDGDNKNHKWENLELLCPNCHSQTENYCRKNKLNTAL